MKNYTLEPILKCTFTQTNIPYLGIVLIRKNDWSEHKWKKLYSPFEE